VSLGLPATAGAYLADRARLLDWRLRRFAGALRREAVEDVEIRGGKLRVTPLSADVPSEAVCLDAVVDRLLPKVRITRLLSEVARRTGFTDQFTELRSGKTHPIHKPCWLRRSPTGPILAWSEWQTAAKA
jgi:hypothetical protein